MRHRKTGRKFGRKTDQRLALLRSLCTSMVKYERITTTLPKAKDLRRVIEKAVTMAKNEGSEKTCELGAFFHSPHNKELVGRDTIKKYISNLPKAIREQAETYLKDQSKPKPDFVIDYLPVKGGTRKGPKILRIEGTVSKLINRIAPRFKDVPGGYTRIYKLGPRRGDAAEMALIEFTRL